MEAAQLNVYRGCTPVVDDRYGAESGRSPSEVIVNALAEAAGSDPLDLPPLYEFVDPDAIDRLFDQHGGSTAADAIISFQADRWNVFVRADGRVRVCDATKPTDPQPVFGSSPA